MDAYVRPARPSDKAPLMNFIREVWGGHDYIPGVWDDWIRDNRNEMFVVDLEGVAVGMNRLRFPEDGSAWFEGVRVHPDFRRKGLATMLGENAMKVAKERGIKVFRLTSSSRNKIAHRQIARIRFKEICRFSVYGPKRVPQGNGEARLLSSGQLGVAIRLIRDSKEYRLGHGFFWHDWGAALLTPAVISTLIDEGAIWRFGRAVAVTRKGGKGRGSWQEVGFVGGAPSDAVPLVKSILGKERKAAERWVFLPQGSPIVHGLRDAGFRRRYANILFERRAAKG